MSRATNNASQVEPPTLAKRSITIFAVIFWLLIVLLYIWQVSLHLTEPITRPVVQQALATPFTKLINFIKDHPLGPLIYILVYTLRPLIFFSALVLTLAGGFLFGPVWGIVYTIIGANAGASLAYGLGRVLGGGMLEHTPTLIQTYTERLRSSSFVTVFIMRLAYLPYDLVNYLCGILRINFIAFLLATILGSLPGTVSFVLLGATSQTKGEFTGDFSVSFDWRIFAASVAIFLLGLGISRVVKKREHRSAT